MHYSSIYHAAIFPLNNPLIANWTKFDEKHLIKSVSSTKFVKHSFHLTIRFSINQNK